MEAPRFQKTSQGYHGRRVEHRPRVFRTKKEETPFNHTLNKQNKQSGQLGEGKKVHVSYDPCEEVKSLHVKHAELAASASRQDSGNKDQNKTYIRRNDAKEYKTNFKDGERRKYPSKERNYGRPFKTFHAGKSQNKTRDLSTTHINNEINTKKEQHKLEKELNSVKQNNVDVTHYSKPAVHVQPLQQLPEGGRSGVSERHSEVKHTDDPKKSDLLSKDSTQQPQHMLNESHSIPGKIIEEQSKEERSFENENKLCTEQEEKSEKTSPKPVQKSLVRDDNKVDKPKSGLSFPQSTSYHDGSCIDKRSNLMANVKCDDMRTVHGFCSSAFGVHPRLKSSEAANEPVVKERLTSAQPPALHKMAEQSKGPANGITTDASIKTSNNSCCHYLSKEEKPLLEISPGSEQNEQIQPLVNSSVVKGSHDETKQLKSLESWSSEKYGYRISVDSLFSSSFFENPQEDSNGNKEQDSTSICFENGESRKGVGVICSQALTVDLSDNQTDDTLEETTKHTAVNSDITEGQNTSFLPHDNSFPSPPSPTRTPDYKQNENSAVRVVSPRSRSQKGNESSHSAGNGFEFSPESPRNELLRKTNQCDVESECKSELANGSSFASQDIKIETYKYISDHAEDTFSHGGVQNTNLTLFPSVKSSDMVKTKDPPDSIQKLKHNEILNDPERQQGNTKNKSEIHISSLTDKDTSINRTELPTSVHASIRKGDVATAYPTDKTSQCTETQPHSSSSEVDNEPFEKYSEGSIRGDDEDIQVHGSTFSQGPYIPNPFLGHSLLTHRHAIPSAFVYPSRVGIPSGHSGFNEVGQHSGTSPSSHLFPPHGTTVCINVGGRLFEVLPSTFAAYPESLLYQIFTGATSAPINQRGHIFFDRDGYLFETLLAFARVGNLTLPPRLSLTSLMNEAKFFGMYEYMFKQGPLPSESQFHFQRTTCCTLCFDISTHKSETKVFVLQGEDKLKIESLKVSGASHLYVDLYTPSGVKETSNFLLYDSEKPNLWKAYQFCADRQLVFHLGQTNTEYSLDDNPSVQIVFSQTFVFHGDEFIP